MGRASNLMLRRFERLRRHAAIALAVFVGGAVVGLANVMDATGRLIAPLAAALFGSPEEARAELTRLGLPYTAASFVDCARTGDRVAVRWYLRAGIDPDAEISNGTTALIAAILNGRPEIAAELLDWGAAAAGSARRDDALSLAAATGGHEIVSLLLHARFTPGALDQALALAAAVGSAESSELLQDQGALLSRTGGLSLIQALRKRRGGPSTAQHLKSLMSLGANPNGADESGWTPLLDAVHAGDMDSTRALLDSGADINPSCACPELREEGGGWTPLMLAAMNGQREMVELLLARGAAIDRRNEQGSTALMLAQSRGQESAAELLRTRGASADSGKRAGGSRELQAIPGADGRQPPDRGALPKPQF